MLSSGFSLVESNPLHLIQFMLQSTEGEEVEEGKKASVIFLSFLQNKRGRDGEVKEPVLDFCIPLRWAVH